MSRIPSIEDLEREFGRYLDSPGVLSVSTWNQPNADEPFDEEAYLERSAKNSDFLWKLLGDGFSE